MPVVNLLVRFLPISATSHESFWLPSEMVELSFGDRGQLQGVNPINLTGIREIRLEIRPYEWAEFRNIALQPANEVRTK